MTGHQIINTTMTFHFWM